MSVLSCWAMRVNPAPHLRFHDDGGEARHEDCVLVKIMVLRAISVIERLVGEVQSGG
jgi:hypothetical protein